MKQLLKDQMPPAEISNQASSSEQSKYDQEMGSNATSRSADASARNSAFCRFPHGMDLDLARSVIAEAVGTFILMFCISGIIESTHLVGSELALLEYAATAALTVIVVVFSIGAISGAHVNPAVTIAFTALGHFPMSKALLYILAQIVGSVLATYVGGLVYGIKPDVMITRPLHGCTSAFWVELIATFTMMFLAAALASEAQCVGYLSCFAAGAAIGLAVLITGPISGGSMNPARSLGPAIVSWKFDDVWIYVIAPTVGAVAGALMYGLLRIQPRPSPSTSSPNASLLCPSLH